MAPTIATAEPRSVFGWSKPAAKPLPAATEVELRRLKKEVVAGTEREEELTKRLEKVMKRLRVAEEAEERLCVQLGELEAESAERDAEYRRRIRELAGELERTKTIHHISSSSSLSSQK